MKSQQITKFFKKPFFDTFSSFEKVLTQLYGKCEKHGNTLSADIFKKRYAGPDDVIKLGVSLKAYNQGTAVFIEFNYDSTVFNYDEESRKLISAIEKELGVYASFLNFDKSMFESIEYKTKEKVDRNDETSKEDAGVIADEETFKNAVEKLKSLKKLLDNKIITKKEYEEKIKPLIEEL